MRAIGTLAIVLLVCACEPRTITLQSPTPTGSAGTTFPSGSPTATPVPTPKPALRPLPTAATVSRLLSYERGGDIGVPSLRLLLQAIQTGYFEKDATYAREPLPGSTPPAHGTTFINFVVQNGGRDVHVSTIPTGQPDDNLYQPSPARDKISSLARSFEDLSTLLPSSAWADSAPTNYSAQFHRLFVAPQPVPAPPSAPDAETVWPFTPALGDR